MAFLAGHKHVTTTARYVHADSKAGERVVLALNSQHQSNTEADQSDPRQHQVRLLSSRSSSGSRDRGRTDTPLREPDFESEKQACNDGSSSGSLRQEASANVSERPILATVASSPNPAALAAELLRDVADQKPIEVERLTQLAWAVVARDEIGRVARTVLDAPREHVLRRAVELAAPVLAINVTGAAEPGADARRCVPGP